MLGQHGLMGSPLVQSFTSSMHQHACAASVAPNDASGIAFTEQNRPSCWRRCAFGHRPTLSRSRRQHQAKALRCSSSASPKSTFESAAQKPSSRPSSKLRSVSVRTASTTSRPVPGGRDFFAWLLDLPWNRVGVWVVVAWFMYQLKDFFGVCLPLSLQGLFCWTSSLHKLPDASPCHMSCVFIEASSCEAYFDTIHSF